MAIAATSEAQARGIGALTMAVVLGMLVGNTAYPRWAGRAGPGVGICKQTLLRLGIVLYGLRLTFQDIGRIGAAGVLIDALVLGSTFVLACTLGPRLFGLDRSSAALVGAGSAVCGAAAVLATAPVVRGRPEQVAMAVSTVVVFGTLSMFLYPVLHAWATASGWGLASAAEFGLYAGATVHEVAQVVAVGRALGDEAAATAIVAKMVRVMMLAPFLLLVAFWFARGDAGTAQPGETPRRAPVPWFALGFVAMAGLNSLAIIPPAVVARLLELDTALLAAAMAALGLTTQASALRQAGPRPLALAALLFVWLVGGGAAIHACVRAWLG